MKKDELIIELRNALLKIIEQLRMHIWQMCLVAGAISAFLMPLYASKDFSLVQHTFIALSLASFLFSILVGFLYTAFKLTNDQRNINSMKYCLEEEDIERGEKLVKKISMPIEKQNAPDIASWSVDILFSLGVIFLLIAIVITEWAKI